MTPRQHAPLVLVGPDGARPLAPVDLGARGGGGYDEAWLRDLFFEHPGAVPLGEIDPAFGPLVPVCRELAVRGAGAAAEGYADALFLNPLGMPTLVECKLWRNPQARREVVAQALDYARALKGWTFSDLQREAARARRQQGFDLFAHVRDAADPALDPAAFADAVTRNLARGRLLVLVLGDGIREGVEAIADYLAGSPGSHFTFGLVEAAVFDLGDGRKVVQPRVLAKTMIVNRTVVELVAPGVVLREEGAREAEERAVGDGRPDTKDVAAKTGEPDERARRLKAFWSDVFGGLKLDDAEQPLANPLGSGTVYLSMPSGSRLWLRCRINQRDGWGSVALRGEMHETAREIWRRLDTEHDAIDKEVGLPLDWEPGDDGKAQVAAAAPLPAAPEARIAWFRTTINAFVNALRPRIKAALAEVRGGA